jgi:hypothetical protein
LSAEISKLPGRHALRARCRKDDFLVQAEFILKVVGFGWTEYWNDSWNRFGMFIVAVSTIDAAERAVGLFGNLKLLTILRLSKLLRLFRVSRLVKALKSLTSLMNLISSLAQLSDLIVQVGMITGVLLILFGYWGVLLFGNIQRTG